MSVESIQRSVRVSVIARKVVDILEAIPVADFEAVIAFREQTEKSNLYLDEGVARAGKSLTATLKIILFSREQILAVQASKEDQAACTRHAIEQALKGVGL